MRLGLTASLALLHASSLAAADLHPLATFSERPSPNALRLVSPAAPRQPWTVAGEHGALFGRGNGKFEAWLWPVKVLSNFAIRAELQDYPVPIDVNALAATVDVTPAETVITYSHAAFTVRQHMFAPRGADTPATGAVVFFEIEAARNLQLTFSFTPEMLRMWPAPGYGRPNGEWIGGPSGGAYLLHTDNPLFSAVVAMPHTTPGILVPYQEHPQTYPLELKLSYDPHRDANTVFPLVMKVNPTMPPYSDAVTISAEIPELYKKTQNYYAHFFDHKVVAETPEPRVNQGLKWAEVAIDQMQVRYQGETGLVAGYYESADSARPGYAWFFGRDTLWTTYAINSYGDYALTRRALDFLIRRQRADGKIMHEFSQSAGAVDWNATPYFYASADATPLLVMALWDYVRVSGDLDYLQRTWPAVRKAYLFTRAHESKQGIYCNVEGTGWVESWPPGMPYQEIYLASLDQQSAQAASHLAALMQDQELSRAAAEKGAAIRRDIEAEYYDATAHMYAFSRNADGSLDRTATIYPSVAWWDGSFSLARGQEVFPRWASAEFSTDWGTRDISPHTPFYDPISYHQGSIWPLFTGWVSLAEYRGGANLSGYAHLMQNINLTWAQDLGSVTELLSGEFFEPLGRSSSHQMWSSAMIVSPLLRGLFGLEWDAAKHTLQVAPQLPANWPISKLYNVPLGASSVNLTFERKSAQLSVQAAASHGNSFCLIGPGSLASACKPSNLQTIVIPLKPVELTMPSSAPPAGATTQQLKALGEQFSERKAIFRFEAPGGSVFDLPIRLNRPGVSVQGGELIGGEVRLWFENGPGYREKTMTFVW